MTARGPLNELVAAPFELAHGALSPFQYTRVDREGNAVGQWTRRSTILPRHFRSWWPDMGLFCDERGFSMPERTPEVSGKTVPQTPEILAANQFYSYLEAKAASDENEPSDFMAQQVGAILTAGSSAEMWEADNGEGVANSLSMIDVEMAIYSFTVHKGQIEYSEGSYPFFMVVHGARLSTGEEVVYSTGAPLIMAKLKYLEDHDELPAECVIRETQTRKGFRVLKLHKLSERPVKGTAK